MLLIDLSNMTEQELFNKSVAGLAGQGWQRAIGESGTCLYLTEDGMRCAVGHVLNLSDDELKRLNCGSWGRVVDDGLATPDHKDFLIELQRCHDLSSDSTKVISSLLRLARRYALTIPPVLAEAVAVYFHPGDNNVSTLPD